MKKIVKNLFVLLIIILLTSCTNKSPEELNSLIQMPKQDDLSITGTWKVVDIKNGKKTGSEDNYKIGDLVYIDKNLAAIGDNYAFPPTYSSKYVNLSKYLANRGIETHNIDKNENVVVINASQGQLFSKDFIKKSETKMYFTINDNFIEIEKISNKVDSKVLADYSKKASKDRTTTPDGEEVEEDAALLLGVRERIDSSEEESIYNYYTYLLRIKDSDTISYKKVYNIFVKNNEEYWSVNSKNNNITSNYDEIISYPVRLRDRMIDSATRTTYSFKDINLDMRINYVSDDFVSIDYTRSENENPIRKYAILETKNLKNPKFLSLEEFTGEEDSDLIFKERVLDEAESEFENIDKEKVAFDNTNFGIVRNQGQWIFQSSIHTGDGDSFVQNFFPMEIAIGNQMLNKNTTGNSITRDMVRNINNQFKDYYVLSNGKYIVIQTPDEILVHRIKDNLIEKNPIYSIPTINSSTIVSVEEQLGTSAENLETAFTNYNEIIEGKN
ncbi:hypothetical protein [Anaerococcus vaginimassiliensis]|uniref:hypothetical protein n=1 Tax=Anaerococcus vaginimassiliensis TaxID=2042308 RepID=UPI0010300491|nr:hypothetical protein [Anaerococcus vaginimassiliensis]